MDIKNIVIYVILTLLLGYTVLSDYTFFTHEKQIKRLQEKITYQSCCIEFLQKERVKTYDNEEVHIQQLQALVADLQERMGKQENK